jgi:arylsulfatase A-like enzyme
VSTPNIDRLASEGIRFDRCLVPNSICGPSRATVLTGKYSHSNGFYDNTNSLFDGSQTTFPKLLRAGGYQTALFGKWHLVTDPTMQGRSLVPLLEGQTPGDWRTSLYYHYYEFPGPHNVRRHYGVVTDRYKLVHFYEPEVNEWELFDLTIDPRELHSVFGWADHATVQRELSGELERLRRRLGVPFPDPPAAMIKAEGTPRVP